LNPGVTADTDSVWQSPQTGLCNRAESGDKDKGMKPEGLDRLTEKQRECLRLVYAHKETKEIARLLGLSPDGVTQRIKAAMRTLGVDRRRDAAIILARAEGLETYPRQVAPSRDIASTPDPTMIGPTIEGTQHEGVSAVGMREQQAQFEVAASIRPWPVQMPLPIGGSRPDDLSWLRRLGWIIGIMLAIALVFGMFLAGLESLSRMGR
jgi:DNA-binding CsgD family transcriptional regulator